MLRTLGFPSLPGELASGILTEPNYPVDAMFSVRVGDGLETPKSLHAIAGPFGFLPIRSRSDFRLIRIAKRFVGNAAIVSLSDRRLAGDIETSETTLPGERSIERNGFILTLIDEKSDLSIVQ